MSKSLTLSLIAVAGLMFTAGANAQNSTSAKPANQQPPAAAASSNSSNLPTQTDKFSYALGMNLGSNLKRQSVDVNPDVLARGLRDAIAGGKTELTEAEARDVLTQAQNEFHQKQMEKMKELGEANKKEGDAFLAANKTKEGVTTLPSGLQYKVLTEGKGPKPTATDTVTVNYRGTLINGTEFDSSYKRGQPATFAVGGVIKGWTEVLQLMPVGSKWQVFIPSDLAYGERGAGADIGPNSTLIFDVELLSIKAPEKTEDKKPSENPAEKK